MKLLLIIFTIFIFNFGVKENEDLFSKLSGQDISTEGYKIGASLLKDGIKVETQFGDFEVIEYSLVYIGKVNHGDIIETTVKGNTFKFGEKIIFDSLAIDDMFLIENVTVNKDNTPQKIKGFMIKII